MAGFFNSLTKKGTSPPPSLPPTPLSPTPETETVAETSEMSEVETEVPETTGRRERRRRDASPPLPDVEAVLDELEAMVSGGHRYAAAAERILRKTESQRRRQRERGTPDICPDDSLVSAVLAAIKRAQGR